MDYSLLLYYANKFDIPLCSTTPRAMTRDNAICLSERMHSHRLGLAEARFAICANPDCRKEFRKIDAESRFCSLNCAKNHRHITPRRIDLARLTRPQIATLLDVSEVNVAILRARGHLPSPTTMDDVALLTRSDWATDFRGNNSVIPGDFRSTKRAEVVRQFAAMGILAPIMSKKARA